MAEDPLAEYREVTADLTGRGGPFALQFTDDPRKREFAGTPESLVAVLLEARRRYADQRFLSNEDDHRSFEEIFSAADHVAANLRDMHQIRAGDRVGLAMRNRIEWFIAFFAIQRLGAIATLLNSRGAAEELASTAEQVGCSVVIADDARSERLRDCAACAVIDLVDLEALSSGGNLETLADVPAPDSDDPSLIIFTSGTTGKPKGATLTHRNLCSVIRDLQLRIETMMQLIARQFGQDVEDIRPVMPPPPPTLLITPLFHISGIVSMLSSFFTGSRIILMRRWDAEQALDLIEANGVGALSGPSLVFSDLLELPDAVQRMKSLRQSAIAGQATPARLGAQLRDGLPGMGVTSSWGQTELTGAATTATAALFAAHPGSVGLRVETLDIKVIDGDGNSLPAGEVGELCVRGPSVMKGYWGDDQANEAGFKDGWLCSGDLGWIDGDGLIYIADRAKDMVISAGQNIYCAEVERVLSMLEEQQEVALFGVADERLGERTIAAVVLRGDAASSLSEEDVREHVRKHLADYKVPTEVRFDLGPFPRNDLGKIDKTKLSQRFHEGQPV